MIMENTTGTGTRGNTVQRPGLWARCAGMRDETGAALVEVAIGVSVCMTLVVGAAELGRVAYAGIEVSDAARAGVQYGAQSRTNAADLPNVITAATQDAPHGKGKKEN